MPEEGTTFLRRTKDFAAQPHVKRTALATTGTGSISLILVWQLFVTKAEFSEYKQEATRKSSVMWQQYQNLDNALDAVKLDIARLQVSTVRTTNTNTP